MIENKTKILFILPSLRAGGAERVVSRLAQNIDKNNFEATLLVIGFEKDKSFLLENLEINYLNKSRVIKAVYPLFKYISKEKPDVVMTSIGHLNILMGIFSLLFKKIKFVVREASVNSSMKKFRRKKLIIPKRIINYVYSQLDAIICQSKDMAIDISNIYNLPLNSLAIINNPVSTNFRVRKEYNLNKDFIRFITVGRLSNEKGHLRIIKILSTINKSFHYTIIGNGPEESIIMKHAEELGIRDKITHIPFTHEIEKHLISNHIFLQGSYVEGFPNALLESCSVGTPVLAFEAPGGTREIIKEGVNGFIVKDEGDFHVKLDKLFTHQWDPLDVSNSVTHKFNEEKINLEYEKLFLNVLGSNNQAN